MGVRGVAAHTPSGSLRKRGRGWSKKVRVRSSGPGQRPWPVHQPPGAQGDRGTKRAQSRQEGV